MLDSLPVEFALPDLVQATIVVPFLSVSSLLHNVNHRHCTRFVHHLVHVAILGFVRCYSCDSAREVLLACFVFCTWISLTRIVWTSTSLSGIQDLRTVIQRQNLGT